MSGSSSREQASRRRVGSSTYSYRENDDGTAADVLDSRIGVYGWRKRCLYFLVLLLLVILIINLGLLLWITRVMDFNVDGMGKLRIHSNRITVQGRSEFTQALYAQEIVAETNSSLRLSSATAVNVTAGRSQLYLDTKSVLARAAKLEVKDNNNTAYFTVTPTRLLANTDSIVLNGSRGAAFKDFVQTGEVHGETGKPLEITSPSNRLTLLGPAGVHLRASGSGLNIYSPAQVQLQATAGQVLINASRILLPSLQVVQPSSSTPSPQQLANVYEVCACRNTGQLFLVLPGMDKPCEAGADQC